MTIKQAIEKAIEGGWGGSWKSKPIVEMLENKLVGFHYPGTMDGVQLSMYDIFLQPSFWQSLGKAMGWEEYCCEWCGVTETKLNQDGDADLCKSCGTPIDEECAYKTYRFKWHRFIDHLAEGGTPESFFEAL